MTKTDRERIAYGRAILSFSLSFGVTVEKKHLTAQMDALMRDKAATYLRKGVPGEQGIETRRMPDVAPDAQELSRMHRPAQPPVVTYILNGEGIPRKLDAKRLEEIRERVRRHISDSPIIRSKYTKED